MSGKAQSNVAVETVPLTINGKDYYPEKTFDVVSPDHGNVVHRCGSATVADAETAVNAAADAFKTWRKTTPQQRRTIFLKAADIMDERADELAGYMMAEVGASRHWCQVNFGLTTDLIRDVAGRIAAVNGSFPALRDPDSSCIIMKEPYGVVLAIAPWYVWPIASDISYQAHSHN